MWSDPLLGMKSNSKLFTGLEVWILPGDGPHRCDTSEAKDAATICVVVSWPTIRSNDESIWLQWSCNDRVSSRLLLIPVHFQIPHQRECWLYPAAQLSTNAAPKLSNTAHRAAMDLIVAGALSIEWTHRWEMLHCWASCSPRKPRGLLYMVIMVMVMVIWLWLYPGLMSWMSWTNGWNQCLAVWLNSCKTAWIKRIQSLCDAVEVASKKPTDHGSHVSNSWYVHLWSSSWRASSESPPRHLWGQFVLVIPNSSMW